MKPLFTCANLQMLTVLLLLSILTGLRAEQPNTPKSNTPKNVLFIISDDLNNLLGCYGDPLAKTPNIDRLAARGAIFQKAYCTFPLCGPSRNSMLTGLYPNSTGIIQNSQIFRQTIPSQLSLPQAFRLHGYFVARIGKLYHYNVPNSIGTNGHDDPASWELELNPAGVDRMEEEPSIYSLTPGQFGGTLSYYASPKSDEFHTDGMMASDSQWVLQRCAVQRDRPFFLALGFFRPHTPYVAPRKPYFELFRKEMMPLVKGVAEDQADLPSAALASYKKEQDKLTDDLRQQFKHAYYASISFMDAQVGKVIDSLDQLGLSKNTIIVFTSDHGYHTGEHGLWQKMSLFEESSRVPLLIIAPGEVQPGTVINTPVSQVDLYPTLAELCGVSTPKNLQGQSLAGIMRDPQAVGRGWALTQVTRNEKRGNNSEQYFGYSLRTSRWRFTQWNSQQPEAELYDHESDPGELTNLAKKADYQETIKQLASQLDTAVKSTFPASGLRPTLAEAAWAPILKEKK